MNKLNAQIQLDARINAVLNEMKRTKDSLQRASVELSEMRSLAAVARDDMESVRVELLEEMVGIEQNALNSVEHHLKIHLLRMRSK